MKRTDDGLPGKKDHSRQPFAISARPYSPLIFQHPREAK